MKPFQLETVLNYRQRLEDIAKSRLQKAETARRKAQEQLEQLQHKYTSLLETVERLQHEGVDITELIRYEERLNYLRSNLALLRSELAKHQKLVHTERQNLITRSKERQIMEKLKERQNSAYRLHLAKKDAALLDEIAIIFRNR